MASTSKDDLPLGTSSEHARMHTVIRRVCYVLLFGLVLEGAVTFPLLAVWYGFPQLSPRQVCSGLEQVEYSDKTLECKYPYPLGGPPFGGPSEAKGEKTSQDVWGPQPQPGYPPIGFRELVKNEKKAGAATKSQKPTESTPSARSKATQ